MVEQSTTLCEPCEGTGFTEDDGVCLSCMKTGDADWRRHRPASAKETASAVASTVILWPDPDNPAAYDAVLACEHIGG
jgi:hypothetical protein